MSMITFDQLKNKEAAIAVVGLGYVGLPLAVALGRHFRVVGVDLSENRVRELEDGYDRTNEIDFADVGDDVDLTDLSEARFVLVAVPTPIDEYRSPDLRPIRGASKSVGRYLQPGSMVVFESTVFPGLTEEICVPILEDESGLKCGTDFFVGYSPERINPGDKVHRLETIVKVVAGQDEASGRLLQDVYGTIVEAGTHLAGDIRTAEAAKVIENTQRDLNIALMNELSMIFDRMGIDTLDVLEAEFPPVQAWAGGRPLHRRGPLLPDVQGRGHGLSSPCHPGRPRDQRRNGQVHCRIRCQEAHQERHENQGRTCRSPWTDVQGERA